MRSARSQVWTSSLSLTRALVSVAEVIEGIRLVETITELPVEADGSPIAGDGSVMSH